MKMNRINRLFQTKKNNILSIYFTAGYPFIDSTKEIITNLVMAGVDMIEIGMPFSDPLADGHVIQKSSETALKNGMTMKLLFRQLADIRKTISIPLLLMGYINPVLKFGMNEFCYNCALTGIDGVILPDLPPEIYSDQYTDVFKKNDLHNVLLISPQTDKKRIEIIDSISRGFIYMVSSSSTTGNKAAFSEVQLDYFNRIKKMNLINPRLIGFGISDSDSFDAACRFAEGAVIGSAFIKLLAEKGSNPDAIRQFISKIKDGKKIK